MTLPIAHLQSHVDSAVLPLLVILADLVFLVAREPVKTIIKS